MNRTRILGILTLLLPVGCATTDPPASTPVQPQAPADFQARLNQSETEKAALRRDLDNERARAAGLETRLANESRTWESDRAIVGTLRNRVEQLSKQNADLVAAVEQRQQRPLERPQVAASPLPADLDGALQALARKYAGRVWYDQGRGAISFANDRLFDSGSDAVRADAQASLGELADIVAKPAANEFELIVIGHTDDTPIGQRETQAKHPTNWHLSVHRAIAVKNVLTARGLPEARMGVMGYGQYRPVSDDKVRNRRVEIFLVRKGDVQGFTPVRGAANNK